jgi:hypothetical protein
MNFLTSALRNALFHLKWTKKIASKHAIFFKKSCWIRIKHYQCLKLNVSWAVKKFEKNEIIFPRFSQWPEVGFPKKEENIWSAKVSRLSSRILGKCSNFVYQVVYFKAMKTFPTRSNKSWPHNLSRSSKNRLHAVCLEWRSWSAKTFPFQFATFSVLFVTVTIKQTILAIRRINEDTLRKIQRNFLAIHIQILIGGSTVDFEAS